MATEDICPQLHKPSLPMKVRVALTVDMAFLYWERKAIFKKSYVCKFCYSSLIQLLRKNIEGKITNYILTPCLIEELNMYIDLKEE